MSLWEKFVKMNPAWDRFKLLPAFKQAMYAFLPIAEKLAPEPDLRNNIIAYYDSIMNELRANCDKLGRNNDRVLRPIQKSALGLITSDPAYLNYATALIALIKTRKFEFTHKQKAWLKHRFGIEIT